MVPNRQLVILSLLPLAVTMSLYVLPAATAVVLAIDLILVIAILIDSFTIPKSKQLIVTREMRSVATRGERHPIEISVTNRSKRTLTMQIQEDLDQSIEVDQDVIDATVDPKSRISFTIHITPSKRGEYTLQYVHLTVVSRFGLWKRFYKIGPRETLRVYPALKQISRYAMYARMNRMSLLGLRRTRRAGTDNEFERLRDYNPDDNFKAIDWRATSRRMKLTVKDFQSNQSQRIIFMIDCGRMMVNESDGFSLFDAAIDSALTLGYVALARHDQVGLMCFNNQVVRWVPPKSGRSHLNTMVHAVHDVEPELTESRFDEAFLHLHRHCRKRSLVVLITNLIDDRNASSVEGQVKHLVGKHLPMTVLFRDSELFGPADAVVSQKSLVNVDDVQLYRAAAASDILLWREKVLVDMKNSGVLTLDVFPEDLTAPLINEYLRIKAQTLL